MAAGLFIHPRVMERHPQLTEDDVRAAWDGIVESAMRPLANREEYVALGFDMRGRLIEMVAVREGGRWLVYHALTPPTKKVMKELGIKGGYYGS